MFARECGYSKADRDLPVSALEVHTSEFYEYKKIICPLHDVDSLIVARMERSLFVIEAPLIVRHRLGMFGHLRVCVTLSRGVSGCACILRMNSCDHP